MESHGRWITLTLLGCLILAVWALPVQWQPWLLGLLAGLVGILLLCRLPMPLKVRRLGIIRALRYNVRHYRYGLLVSALMVLPMVCLLVWLGAWSAVVAMGTCWALVAAVVVVAG